MAFPSPKSINGNDNMLKLECRRCKKPFLSYSTKSIRQIYCRTCSAMKKEESQTKRKTDKYYNQIVSLEDRMESIEKETKDTKENIEMIIRAELLSKVDEILEERTENILNQFQKKLNKKLKTFENKIQRQLVTINNRIIEQEKTLSDWLGYDINEDERD